jgi:hypothetical protein
MITKNHWDFDILGHAPFGTSEKHYIMAQSREPGAPYSRRSSGYEEFHRNDLGTSHSQMYIRPLPRLFCTNQSEHLRARPHPVGGDR